jgi:hypothetical protein
MLVFQNYSQNLKKKKKLATHNFVCQTSTVHRPLDLENEGITPQNKGHPSPMTQHHTPQTQDSWKNSIHHIQLPDIIHYSGN